MPAMGTKRKDEVELDPKGWERFERAVDAAVKSGPKHKTAKVANNNRRRCKAK
jgi:hypothetical protein